jgi:hypothetical protein
VTTLREPFDTIRQKKVDTKNGQIVLDYISWSQAAERLDDAAFEGWSFAIMGIGPDWVHGRLTIGERHFENVGYAENADQAWKKEALKDAASDAFKRCAALAGVARYLYEKDSTAGSSSTRQSGNGRAAGPPPAARPPARTTTDLPEEPEWLGDVERMVGQVAVASANAKHADGSGWSFKELAQAAEDKGIAKNVIYQTADSLFGPKTKVTDLTGPQREQIAFEMGLTG